MLWWWKRLRTPTLQMQNDELGASTPPKSALELLLEESQKLRKDVKAAERNRRRLIGLVAGLVVGGLILLIVNLVGVLSTRQIAETIACQTTPGASCFEQARDDADSTLTRILEGQIAVAECQNEATSNLRSCVDLKLNR
jgi:hypothetical protein